MANRFINLRKLKELQAAQKAGNPKAKAIIDKYMEPQADMEAVYRLMDDYYAEAPIDTLNQIQEPAQVEQETPEPVAPEQIEQRAEAEAQSIVPEVEQPIQMPEFAEVDISADLDRELDGLIDDYSVKDYSLKDYLSDKRKNANRAKKDASYFKAFDQAGRENYLSKKKDEYLHGFDNRLRDAERAYNDMDGAIGKYSQLVTDLPDDENEIDVGRAGEAYDELTQNESVMGAFGRSWDDADVETIKTTLTDMVARYGKKNVVAVLNTIREDNNAWYGESKGRIDDSVSKYGKALDGLLK